MVWHSQNPNNIRIYGQRISSAGALVGSNFAISQQGYSHRGPDVAANPQAGEYLVVWHMHTNDLDYSLRARRVRADGTLLGDDELIIAEVDEDSSWPRVAYDANDDEYLVVWQDYRTGNWDIYGQRVSAGGELLGDNFAVSSLAGDETQPALAWDGNSERYLVGWEGWGLGQRVWADGTLDGGPINPSAEINSPDHAYGYVSGLILGVGEIYGDVYAQRYAIPVARFSASPLSGSAPLTVTFTNQSLPTVGLDSFEWAFGDGATSAEESPTHVYTATGVYTVSLTVSSGEESDTATKAGYITVTGGGPAAPLADFTAEPLSGSVPLTVTFTNQSSGEITAYEWAFGDGLTDTITHPVHVYTTTGVYTVSLTATGPGGTDTLTRTSYITATAPEVVETTVITYTYDPLYRLRGAYYSTGEFFAYEYDAVGNVTLASEHITTTRTTTYTYNAASQLVTSTVSGESTVWWYTYDANGNLTHQTPNGTAPADGQVRYTWDALNRLVKVERYVGGSYEPLAEAAYDGSLPLKAKRVGDDVHVGQRTRLTMWVAGQPVTTTYTADPLRPGRVLVAADGTTARRYLYGQGPIGEFDGEWSYHLTDGGGSLRQVADAGGTLTLVRAYKPFGAILEEAGSGASAYGYFGAWWDSGLGLLYWDGRYYDPVTGRFLSPQRGRRNPYSPYGMPLTMGLLAPLAIWSAALGKRRRRWWHWLLLLALVGMGVVAVGCEGETPPSTPTIPVPPTVPPTPGAPEPPPSYTPPPTPTPLPPPTPTLPPTVPPPGTCTPTPGWRKLDQEFRITTYWTVKENDTHYQTGVYKTGDELKPGGIWGERLFDIGFINAVTHEGSGRLEPPFFEEKTRIEWPYIDSKLDPILYPVTASGEQAIPFGTGAIARDNPNPILATAYQLRSTVFIEAISHWPGGGYVKIHDKGGAVQPDQIDVYVGELYVDESRQYVDFVQDSAVWVFEG